MKNTPRPTKNSVCKFLSQCNFDFSHIIDIGVQYKTQELIDNFKNSSHILIEPDARYFDDIYKNYNGLKYQLIKVACSAQNGEFYLHQKPNTSFISREKSNTIIQAESLDTIFLNNNIEKWVLLKIDIDGEERNVLKSSRDCLQKCAFIIVEAKIPYLHEISEILHKANFSIFNIVDLCYIKSSLAQCDLVFINNSVKQMNEEFHPKFDFSAWHKHT